MRHFLILTSLSLAACGGSGGGGSTTTPPPPPPTTVTPVYTIQGSGAASPLDGQAVTIEAQVTGDFQDNDADTANNLGGFYVQDMPDGLFETSDGVFVFDGANPVIDVDVGDLVRVSGTVDEYFGETQIQASAVSIIGAGGLIAAPINLPRAPALSNSDGRPIADLERYEGTLVRFPQTLTVTETWDMESFGAIVLSEGGPQFQFTNRNTPDVAGFNAHEDAVGSRRLILDDGQRDTNVSPVRYRDVRVGDEITNVRGIIRYSRGSGSSGFEGYRLMPTEDPQFVAANPRPGAPNVGGNLRIAGFNVLMMFSTINTGANICGPFGNGPCFGADSALELQRQLDKLATALEMMDADVIGLVELENNASESLEIIVDELNDRLGAGTYTFIDTGTIGTSSIKNGLIYKPGSVSPVGIHAILDSGIDARFDGFRNRPAIAQTFSQNGNGARLTVAVNHLRSKAPSCNSVGDPNEGDGQADCSDTRTNAALALADWLATDPTSSGDTDALIFGDLNAHTMEDPLTALKNAGWVSLVETMVGPDSRSFVFDGQLGTLDHALASPSLAPQVSDVQEWHINAEEPPLYDYNLESGRDPSLFDGTNPYRSSDHDPLLIGLDLAP